MNTLNRTRAVAAGMEALPDTWRAKCDALGVSISTAYLWQSRAKACREDIGRVKPPSDDVLARLVELLDAGTLRLEQVRREIAEHLVERP